MNNMQKKLVAIFITALAALSAKAGDVVRVIELQETGTLSQALGDEQGSLDSIVISGPMNTNDWQALRQCCMSGRVRGLDLSGVKAENDSMPAIALGHMTFHSVLKNVRLPHTLRVIGPRAFKWCTSLEYVELPETLVGIGWEAFYTCTSLKHVDFPLSLESIGNSAFGDCGLESVELPANIRRLGSETFAGCRELKEAVIPSGIESLGWGTFRGCWTLERIALPDDIDMMPDRMFEDCESLSSCEWPLTLETIGEGAFEGCSFESIILPDNIREIAKDAFRYNEKLVSIVLPANLEIFDQTALLGTDKRLSSVYCKATVPPITIGNPYFHDEIVKYARHALFTCLPAATMHTTLPSTGMSSRR